MSLLTTDDITNVQDFFSLKDSCLFRIVPNYKVDYILKNGLLVRDGHCFKKGTKQGVYVIWQDDLRIQSSILETQVAGDDYSNLNLKTDYSIIKLDVSKYQIKPEDISPDWNGNGDEPDINSFSFVITKDIKDIDPNDITPFNPGSSDLYGISFFDLKGYNIEHKPEYYEELQELGVYREIEWVDYGEIGNLENKTL